MSLGYHLISTVYKLHIRPAFVVNLYAYMRNRLGFWDAETTTLYTRIVSQKSGYMGLYYGIEYLWKVNGLDKLLEYLIDRNFDYLAACKRAEVYALLASIYFDKDQETSKMFYQKSSQIDGEIPNNYLQLRSYSEKETAECKKILSRIHPLMKNMSSIITRLSDVSVVGNSDCETSKKQGEMIDSSSVVIRFNRYSTEDRYAEDYGTKCNIWVVNPAILAELSEVDSTANVLILSSTLIYGLRTDMWKALPSYMDRYEIFYFEESLYQKLVARLKAPPSAGILLLSAIYDVKGSLNHLQTFGFSHSVAHYFDRKKSRFSRHNWVGEQSILEEYLA